MKNIIKKLYLSLLYKLKRNKIYILKANRWSTRNKVTTTFVKKNDDHFPVSFTNRRAKLTPSISWGEFGSFYVKKKDKPSIFVRCHGPPTFEFSSTKNSKFGGKPYV